MPGSVVRVRRKLHCFYGSGQFHAELLARVDKSTSLLPHITQ